jgi:putative membrane-bound dehydrogenase-like protein
MTPAAVLLSALLTVQLAGAAPRAPDDLLVGTGRVDITPEGPIRLSGYGSRRAESDGVEQRLWAKAIAIGDEAPAVLLAVDSTGVPAHVTEEVARRLAERAGVARERFVLASTHTHTAPMIAGMLDTLFGEPLPPEHAEHVRRYTERLVDQLERAALTALVDRRPARLGWSQGWAGFAHNRRTAGGPVDRDLPLLRAVDDDGVRAIVVGYACHCTTLGGDFNRTCGDWAGYAQEELERLHPGATALVVIGCGADANPAPRTGLEYARRHGAEIAAEVERLLALDAAPLARAPTGRLERIALDFAPHPSREEWQGRARRSDAVGYHARVQLARLDAGEALATTLPYPVQTWTFGDDLVMAFLPGEVVVDYALRLKRELDAHRTWVVAYANDVPCYIPSRRILAEGGYEAAGAMTYYDRPGPLEPSTEERIFEALERLTPDDFRTGPAGLPTPLAPGPAAARMRVRPGLRVELAACEPQVVDPVALDFADDGRLWVVEMRDYPSGMLGEGEPGGRVRVLDDDDGDGFYERSRVFLDDLAFPTGLLCWQDGVLVCAAPQVLFARDTTGDGRADDVRVLLDGFATENFQARVNGLTLGLDGWVYGACGLLGGDVRSFSGSMLEGARDFRFRPDTGELEAASGLTQQGRDRNDAGDWFGCDNSTLAWHYPLPEHELRRNPHVAPPATRVSLAQHEDDNRLFPLSRALERYNDAQHTGRVTSACGLAVYRDELLGADVRGDLFVCEPVHNLVTRRRPTPRGSTFAGARLADEEASEFLRSSDPWFRPVQVRMAPDGALLVVDMARAVIEHPRWISASWLERLDLRAGDDLGRIWRVLPEARAPRAVPDVARLRGAALVDALENPNGWVRDRATRALVRRGGAELAPLLVDAARAGASPLARLHALCALDGLGALAEPELARALADPAPAVRRHALRLAQGRLASERVLAAALPLARDPDAQVRLQLAFLLAESRDEGAGAALARLLENGDAFLVAAVLSSAQHHLAPLLRAAASGGPQRRALQRELAGLALRSGRDDLVRELLLETLPAAQQPLAAPELEFLAALLGDALQGERALDELRADPQWTVVLERLDVVAGRARAAAREPTLELELRARAVELASFSRAADVPAWLATLLAPDVPPRLQTVAARALAGHGAPGARALFERWPRVSPEVRAEVQRALLSREAGALLLVESLEASPAAARALDAPSRAALLAHASEPVRARASALLAASTDPDRAAVIARYAGVDPARGDARRGAAVFGESCARCHRFAGIGAHLGPDLAALTERSTEALLVAILDPGRAFLAPYATYAVETKAGVLLSGMIGEETGVSFVLVDGDGSARRVLREDVAQLRATQSSLMPAGLESSIDPPAMADLLAFLATTPAAPKRFPGNEPRLVVAEADGALRLDAARAEIFGGDICFEEPFGNIGFWHGPADHVAWQVEVPEAGEWSVVLEWACEPGTAGNRFAIEAGDARLVAAVPATSSWSDYREQRFGALALGAGRQRVVVRAEGAPSAALFDLRAVRLER